MVDANFYKRLDATIAGKPDDEGNLPFVSLGEAHAEFHSLPVPECPASPSTIAWWFAGYDSLIDILQTDKPWVVALARPSHDSLSPWTRALGDSILRPMVREYEANMDPARDWSKCDVEVRKADDWQAQHFTSLAGGHIYVDPERGKFAVCERVLPEMINAEDIAPLHGLPAKLATRFKQHQFDMLRDLAGSVEAMAKCKFGVAVGLTEKPHLSIRWDIKSEEIVFMARGYFGAAVIS